MSRLRLHPENHLVGRIGLAESRGARGKRWNGALAMALTVGRYRQVVRHGGLKIRLVDGNAHTRAFPTHRDLGSGFK